MKQLRFVTGYDRMPDIKLLTAAQTVKQCLTTNTLIPVPPSLLTEFTEAVTAFAKARIAASTGDYLAIADRNMLREPLVSLMHQLGHFVLYIAKGDELMIASSGFTLAKDKSNRPPLTKPCLPRVLNTDQIGELQTTINAVPGALSYIYQYTTDPELKPESWQMILSSKRQCLVRRLQPGTRYYLRVGAVGPRQQVMYSDVVNRMAA